MSGVPATVGSESRGAVLDICNLTVSLPKGADRPFAIEDVSVTVNAGEIVCIVGESGSGKSVTAFTVMGLNDPNALKPVQGEVLLDGENLFAKSGDRSLPPSWREDGNDFSRTDDRPQSGDEGR